MSAFVEAVRRHARAEPARTAVSHGRTAFGYGALARAIDALARRLTGPVVGILARNQPAWIALDLAVQARGACCVPLPPFFSDAQLAHVIADAGIDQIMTDEPARVRALTGVPGEGPLTVLDGALHRFALPGSERTRAAHGLAKITYTSGTTGEPRGVCLGAPAIERVARSLADAVGASERDRALCLLPLATLLENVGSAYVALLVGASMRIAPPALVGAALAGRLEPVGFATALRALAPSTAILVPQLLQALVEAAQAGAAPCESLRFAAVGGAPVARRMLRGAARAGIPVFEGYGLSEAASVVTLNRPGANRTGTVGRPLPHARVRIAADGEVIVGGALFEGYLGGAPRRGRDWRTGDLGRLDEAGHLVLTGRKKSAWATAYGRKLVPEWVERELLAEEVVRHAVVFGEAQPFNVALIVPRAGRHAELAAAVARTNRRLPAYARVHRFVSVPTPLTAAAGLLTGNGRVRRAEVWDRYRTELEQLYEERRSGIS